MRALVLAWVVVLGAAACASGRSAREQALLDAARLPQDGPARLREKLEAVARADGMVVGRVTSVGDGRLVLQGLREDKGEQSVLLPSGATVTRAGRPAPALPEPGAEVRVFYAGDAGRREAVLVEVLTTRQAGMLRDWVRSAPEGSGRPPALGPDLTPR